MDSDKGWEVIAEESKVNSFPLDKLMYSTDAFHQNKNNGLTTTNYAQLYKDAK